VLFGQFLFERNETLDSGIVISRMAHETLILGGGCFWCIEAIFRDLKGVQRVENGYTGGETLNPSYREVCTGTTGHAEVIKIEFDSSEISRTDLLGIFFTVHDPTTLNRQGGDVGTQYRSAIFFASDAEKETAQAIIDEINQEAIWPKPIVTTLEPLGEYYPAEAYHQDYFQKFESASLIDKLSMNAGYCQAVIMPKVVKFRKAYADRLRR
jgi:peptide-methionine (S)-S-oxide reductase